MARLDRRPLLATLVLLLLATPLGRSASSPQPLEEWEDVSVANIGAEPMHATFESVRRRDARCGDASAARRGCSRCPARGSSRGCRVASGRTGSSRPGFDVSGWPDFPVPANWETNGYGVPLLLDEAVTFPPYPPQPPYVPRDGNPVGSYRRSFRVPEAWRGRRVFRPLRRRQLRVLRLGERRAGRLQPGLRTPAEFDITALPARRRQHARRSRCTATAVGTYLELQDMWRLSGIHRDVTLRSMPDVHLRDF